MANSLSFGLLRKIPTYLSSFLSVFFLLSALDFPFFFLPSKVSFSFAQITFSHGLPDATAAAVLWILMEAVLWKCSSARGTWPSQRDWV